MGRADDTSFLDDFDLPGFGRWTRDGRSGEVLQAMYTDVQSCCLVGEERTEWFSVEVGVRRVRLIPGSV